MYLILKIEQKLQTLVIKTTNSLYEWYMRKRLKNKDFSILCSNCIGGVIYHRLGLQFRSPTVNLWMRQKDFITLAHNLKEYQYEPLEFIHTEFDYPVAKLGSITIYFNHSQSQEEAQNEWQRRMKRLNFDNLFLIMYDQEDIVEEDILSLDQIPCKGKMVISEKFYPHIPYVKTITPGRMPLGTHFNQKTWFGLRAYETKIDFVKWLNQE